MDRVLHLMQEESVGVGGLPTGDRQATRTLLRDAMHVVKERCSIEPIDGEMFVDSKQDLPILSFISRLAWEQWLAGQDAASRGLWLKIAKKGSGINSVSYAEALEVALCYGWIDGRKGAYDETHWLQRFTPRRPRSKWSQVNRDKATELIERGEMQPAGLRQVQRAREDGRWDAAYEAQSRVTVPDDLQQELAKNDTAQALFATLDRLNRYAILYRIADAKKPETRARRIATYVAMLSEGKTIYPPK